MYEKQNTQTHTHTHVFEVVCRVVCHEVCGVGVQVECHKEKQYKCLNHTNLNVLMLLF